MDGSIDLSNVLPTCPLTSAVCHGLIDALLLPACLYACNAFRSIESSRRIESRKPVWPLVSLGKHTKKKVEEARRKLEDTNSVVVLLYWRGKHAVVMFNFLIFTGKQECQQMLMSSSLAGFMDACLHYRPSELYGRLGIVWIDNRISMRHEIYERI